MPPVASAASPPLDPLDAMLGYRVHDVKLIKVLAVGTFGAVYEAENVGDRARFAVKCLFKDGLKPEHLAQQRAEIAINQRLGRHANVVAMTDTLETDAHILLVFEYAARGDLYDLIKRDAHGIYDKAFARTLFQQVTAGVQHCHDREVYHRDLKPENILLTDDWVVKVADFGLATTNRTPRDFGCGSAPYMAPEVIDRADATYDAAAADVWSLGVIFFNMLFGVNPWEKAVANDRHFRHYLADPAAFFSARFEMAPGVQRVLVATLEPEPRRRLTLPQLQQQVACLDLSELYPSPRRFSSSPAVSIKSHALTSRPIVPGATATSAPRTGGGLLNAANAASSSFANSPQAKSHASTASPLSVVVGSWADDDDTMDFTAPVVFRDGPGQDSEGGGAEEDEDDVDNDGSQDARVPALDAATSVPRPAASDDAARSASPDNIFELELGTSATRASPPAAAKGTDAPSPRERTHSARERAAAGRPPRPTSASSGSPPVPAPPGGTTAAAALAAMRLTQRHHHGGASVPDGSAARTVKKDVGRVPASGTAATNAMSPPPPILVSSSQ